ncbi:MAG: sialic acid-binding periplasmic protein siaP [Clostridia bacterium]|jgi:tripartite ATP-independent transporter DctP family solute receptor|nr:sialic acid-binding periplasmic protein siaP [Clostridia bacterium]
MKKVVSIILALVLVFSLTACSQPTQAPAPEAPKTEAPAASSGDPFAALEPIELVYGNGAAIGAAGDLWGVEFSKLVEQKTNGKLKIGYFPNMQLGNDSEMQQQMLAGEIDIVSLQTAPTTPFVPEVAVFDLPLAFAKYDAAAIDKVLNDSPFNALLNKAYAKAGLINLGFLQGATFREMTSNKEIRSIDDFKGVKIRTMDAKFHLAFWKALGANPTPLPFPELYLSLQQGVVAAQENATDTNVSAKFYEVQKYLVNTHHILYLNQFLMNKSKFDSLDPAYQNAIRESVAEATTTVSQKMSALNENNKKTLVDNGMTSVEFEPAFYDTLIEKSKPVYDEIRQAIGAELVDSLINELEKAK